MKDGNASKAGVLAIFLANAGHPGTGLVTSSPDMPRFELRFVKPGLPSGLEIAVVVREITSDPEACCGGSLGSISV